MSHSPMMWEGSDNPLVEENQHAKDCLLPMGEALPGGGAPRRCRGVGSSALPGGGGLLRRCHTGEGVSRQACANQSAALPAAPWELGCRRA